MSLSFTIPFSNERGTMRDDAGTTIFVTHRIDLLRQVPRILFLEEGRLTGDGTHEELVAGCPEYAEAYHRWEVEEETSLV